MTFNPTPFDDEMAGLHNEPPEDEAPSDGGQMHEYAESIITDFDSISARIEEWTKDKNNFLPHPWVVEDLFRKYNDFYNRNVSLPEEK